MVDINNYLKFSPVYANSNNLSDKELKELHDKLEKLPDEIQNHLMDLNTARTIQGLMQTYQLTEKQTIIISVLVRRVFLKDSVQAQLANNILKYANIDADKAQKITQYLEERIFATIPKPTTGEEKPQPKQQDNVINLKK